jgi:hypothetical protein
MGVAAFLRVDGAETLAAEEAEVLTATEVAVVAEAAEIFRGMSELSAQGR